MANPKKILNDPKKVVAEMIDGLVLANDGRVRKLPDHAAIVRTDLPDSKVALLIGGGSGHEPLFHGFVGRNMGDGAACGQVFAAPAPDIIYEAANAVHRGKGILFLYGNYAGDNMNFDIAAEMLEDDGIDVRTVRVTDDVAAAPPERTHDRRGIAGDIYMIKIVGGAASNWTRSMRSSVLRARPSPTSVRSASRSPPAPSPRPASSPSNWPTTRSRSAWARMARPAWRARR